VGEAVRLGPPLELHADATRCRAGDTVTGSVVLPEGGEVRSLRVTLNFCEHTEDYDDKREVAETQLHAGSVLPGQRFAFTLQVPADAPPTLYSTHGELSWELEAHADVRGFDARQAVSVAILPNG
jgi:hypothetical protein